MIYLNLSELIIDPFKELHKDIKAQKHLRYVYKGGRASGKSTDIAIKMILDIIKYPITGLCVRRVGNTLQESCYEQLKEVITMMGLDSYFRVLVSPLKIIYTPRGNSIIFRGADDPAKIKSIKMSKFPIARLWIEELAEFKTEDDVAMIEQSILRAELPDGLKYMFYYSYNPPKRKQNWVNKKYETQFVNKNTLVHHSDYRGNPYISQAFIEEAEYVKETRPLKYRHDYLGEPIGSGIVPFDNLEFKKITDEEIRNFDNIRQGIDWGYSIDPFHFTRLHYDKKKRRVYIFGEIQKVKLSNRMAYKEIVNKGWNDIEVIADSAEPKSIAEVRDYGLRITGARKGPGSVEYSEKWLDDLDAIIIDPNRCPKTAQEFESIDYQVDRYGEVIPRLEDKDDHSIDAVKYALNNDMRGNLYSFS